MRAVHDRLVISRLVHRFSFGPKPGQYEYLVREGVTTARNRLLRTPAHDAGLASVVDPGLVDLGPFPPSKSTARAIFQQALSQQFSAMTLWWLDRMVLADYPLVERMTWFWHGHWATSISKVVYPLPMKVQNETMRLYGLGSFAGLARAMVVDGALIYWLDGQLNVAQAPNENLGREFMELFTLGVGNYSEDDVKAVAAAFTGYRVTTSNGLVTFQPSVHDYSPLAILGATAPFVAPSLSDYVVSLDANAAFVAQRLWFRFVSTTTSVPTTLVKGFANRDVRSLVEAIARHPAMKDPRHAQAKSPVEWFVSACRALQITPSNLPSTVTVANYLSLMGQVPFAPPSVGGWPYDEAWLTAASFQYRLAFATYLVKNGDLSPVVNASNDVNRSLANWLGVAKWSPRTTQAFSEAQGDPARLALLALCAPEYVVNA